MKRSKPPPTFATQKAGRRERRGETLIYTAGIFSKGERVPDLNRVVDFLRIAMKIARKK